MNKEKRLELRKKKNKINQRYDLIKFIKHFQKVVILNHPELRAFQTGTIKWIDRENGRILINTKNIKNCKEWFQCYFGKNGKLINCDQYSNDVPRIELL